jgi:hypothetical protein
MEGHWCPLWRLCIDSTQMANYGCGKGMNEENLLAMRRRVLELDANPDIKPTALEKAFLEAYRERKKGAYGG